MLQESVRPKFEEDRVINTPYVALKNLKATNRMRPVPEGISKCYPICAQCKTEYEILETEIDRCIYKGGL